MIEEYVCGKWYFVEFNHTGRYGTVMGYLLNYYNGNVVIVGEKGIYHLEYNDIIFMQPINMASADLERLDKKFIEALED